MDDSGSGSDESDSDDEKPKAKAEGVNQKKKPSPKQNKLQKKQFNQEVILSQQMMERIQVLKKMIGSMTVKLVTSSTESLVTHW